MTKSSSLLYSYEGINEVYFSGTRLYLTDGSQPKPAENGIVKVIGTDAASRAVTYYNYDYADGRYYEDPNGAKKLQVTFSPETALEYGSYIYIYKGNSTDSKDLFKSYSYSSYSQLAGQTLEIPAGSFTILLSSSYNRAYGFSITSIVDPDAPTEPGDDTPQYYLYQGTFDTEYYNDNLGTIKDNELVRFFLALDNRNLPLSETVERFLIFGDPSRILLPQFSDGYVLSNRKTFELYGFATPDSTVTVYLDEEKYAEASADSYGRFSLSIKGLADGYHQLEAQDSSGLSSGCKSLSIDTTPPTISDLGLYFHELGSAVLHWVCTDNDIAQFTILKNGVRLGTAGTKYEGIYSYNINASLDDGNIFTVKAEDQAGNVTSVDISTSDQVPPTAPETAPTVEAKTTRSLTVRWTAGTDDRGIAGYNVYLNGAEAVKTTGEDLSCTLTELDQGTAYTVTVKTRDLAGNLSGESPALTASTVAICFEDSNLRESYIVEEFANKRIPVRVAVKADDGSTLSLRSAKLQFRPQGAEDWDWFSLTIGTGNVLSGSWSISGSSADGYLPMGSYELRFLVTDSLGAEAASAPIHAALLKFDDEPPTVPGKPVSDLHDTSSITLHWDASTDNVGVDHYELYRDSVKLADCGAASFTDEALAMNTGYSYRIYRSDSAQGEYKCLSETLQVKEWFENEASVTTDTPYYFYVTAVDAYQNECAPCSAVSATLVEDHESPVLTETGFQDGDWMCRSVTLTATATDNYRLAKAEYAYRPAGKSGWTPLATLPCESVTAGDTFAYTWDIADMTTGSYQIRVRVYDDSINDVSMGYTANAPAEQISTVTIQHYAPPVAPAVSEKITIKTAELSWTYSGELGLLEYYKIYRADSEQGEYRLLKTVKGVRNSGAFSDALPHATTYFYKVVAVDRFEAEAQSKILKVTSIGRDEEPPVAVMMPEILRAAPGVPFQFSAVNSTDNDAIRSYVWSFGDGSTSGEVTPTHTYAEVGTYTVSLTVNDAFGNSNTVSRAMTVVDVSAPDSTCSLVTFHVVDAGKWKIEAGEISFEAKMPGSTRIKISQEDSLGNLEREYTIELVIEEDTLKFKETLSPTGVEGSFRINEDTFDTTLKQKTEKELDVFQSNPYNWFNSELEFSMEQKTSDTSFSATVSAGDFDALYNKSVTTKLTYNGAVARLSFDRAALASIYAYMKEASGTDINVSAARLTAAQMQALGVSQPTYQLQVHSGSGANLSDFEEGRVFVSLPYALEDNQSVLVKHIKEDGSVETLSSVYNSETGCIEFVTTGFSYFTIEEQSGTLGGGVENGELCFRIDNLTRGTGNVFAAEYDLQGRLTAIKRIPVTFTAGLTGTTGLTVDAEHTYKLFVSKADGTLPLCDVWDSKTGS